MKIEFKISSVEFDFDSDVYVEIIGYPKRVESIKEAIIAFVLSHKELKIC